MNFQIKGKQIVSLGLKNSGKSNFVKYALKSQIPNSHLAFDPNDEFKQKWGYTQYVPQNPGDSAELDLCVDQIFKPRMQQLEALIVDEAGRYHQKGGELGGPIGEIVHQGTSHWGKGAWFIDRRPKNLHTDILELAEYIFVHRLTGENDMKKLRNIHPNLPQEVQKISGPEGKGEYPQYSCIMVTPGRNLKMLRPVPEMQNEKPTS